MILQKYAHLREQLKMEEKTMKLRRIMSAMLATAFVTSTVAFAEDASTEGALGVNFTMENEKGTYTFTDEELAAFVDYNIEVNGSSEDTTFVNEPCGIFGEDSRFIVADGTSFSLNEVYRIEFELIDIEKDADGNTSFRQLNTLWNRYTVARLVAIWGPCPTMGPDYSTTLEASDLIEIINKHGEFELNEDMGRGPEYAFTYDDVDMVVVAFYINDELDEDGYAVYPSSDSNYRVITQWLLTEQGATMLNEANAGATAPETPNDTTGDSDGATTDDKNTSGDGTDTSVGDGAFDNAGSTEGADGKDKNSADTGAHSVAAAAGIALAAGAAVLFSRKRK